MANAIIFTTPGGGKRTFRTDPRPGFEGQDVTEAKRFEIQNYVNELLSNRPKFPTAQAAIVAMVSWIEALHEQITGPVPKDVKLGWKAKADWARAWDVNTNPDVPTIYADEMVAAGLAKYPDVQSFVIRVIAKADIYEGVIADTEGLRGRVQDELEAEAAKPTTDPQQYEAILDAAMLEAAQMAAARGITLTG